MVSHESALELHALCDVIPVAVHLSLPRAKRGQRPRPGVRLHTLERPPGPSEVRHVPGCRQPHEVPGCRGVPPGP